MENYFFVTVKSGKLNRRDICYKKQIARGDCCLGRVFNHQMLDTVPLCDDPAQGLRWLSLCLRPPRGPPGPASPLAAAPIGPGGQHWPQPPEISPGGSPSPVFTPTNTSFSRPRTSRGSSGEAHVSLRRRKAYMVQKPAETRVEQGDMSRRQDLLRPAPLSGSSAFVLCRSPLREPADSGINSPHSGPLPPSLCWSCHDNQSSPSMPKHRKSTNNNKRPTFH